MHTSILAFSFLLLNLELFYVILFEQLSYPPSFDIICRITQVGTFPSAFGEFVLF